MPTKNVEVKIKGDADFNQAARETERYGERLEKVANQVAKVNGDKVAKSVATAASKADRAAAKAEKAWKRAGTAITRTLQAASKTKVGQAVIKAADRAGEAWGRTGDRIKSSFDRLADTKFGRSVLSAARDAERAWKTAAGGISSALGRLKDSKLGQAVADGAGKAERAWRKAADGIRSNLGRLKESKLGQAVAKGADKAETAWRRAADGIKSALGRLGGKLGIGKSVEGGARRAEKAWQKAGKGIRGTLRRIAETAGGVLLAGGIERGITAAVDGFGNAVDAASDLNEALSKSNAVFGDSASAVEKFASTAADKLGLSKGAALDAAGGFGNMFDQLGFGSTEAAKLSTGMVGLAADFASFNNADITQVLEAQSSAFRGEYDALQRFLPLINAATVEQKALELSGKSATKELTAQEKALAVNALMFEGAGKAMGDFARTADETANAERRARAEMENMRAEIGQKLLPVQAKLTAVKLQLARVAADVLLPALDKITPVFVEIAGGVQAFLGAWRAADGDVTSSGFPGFMERLANLIRLKVIPALQVVIPRVAAITVAVGKLAVVLTGGLLTAIEFLAGNLPALGGALAAVGAVIALVVVPALIAKTVALWAAVAAWVALNAPLILVVAAVAAVAAGLIWAYQNVDIFRSAVDGVVDLAQFAAARLGELADRIIGWVESIDFSPMLEGARQAWQALWGVVQAAVALIVAVVGGHLQILQGLWNTAMGILTGDWSRAWQGIQQVLQGATQIIAAVVRAAMGILRTTVAAAMAAVLANWRAMWSAVANWARTAWRTITSGVSNGVNAVGAAVARLPGKVRSAAARMWNPIYDNFKAVIDRIKSLWSKLSFKVPKISIPGLGSVGGSVIRAATNLFADGNVAREPIAGIFGEYQGARHNPEITTPESLMAQVFRNELARHGGGGQGGGFHIETVVVDERRSMWRELEELEQMHMAVSQ